MFNSIAPFSISCVRISGPLVSKRIAITRPVSLRIFLIVLIRSKCSAWSPCEKFKRATFIPASANAANFSGASLAGPIVHTILVLFILS